MAKNRAWVAGEDYKRDPDYKTSAANADKNPNITSSGSDNPDVPEKSLNTPSNGGTKETGYNHLDTLKDNNNDNGQDGIEKGALKNGPNIDDGMDR